LRQPILYKKINKSILGILDIIPGIIHGFPGGWFMEERLDTKIVQQYGKELQTIREESLQRPL
jgi:hypothetical protein